jgi:hypothetical protein
MNSALTFRHPSMNFEVEAEVVEEPSAPELWAHVRRLCERLQTPPPDHILAGMEEHRKRAHGRHSDAI